MDKVKITGERNQAARPERYVPAGSSLIDMTVQLNHDLVSWTLKHRLLAVFLAPMYWNQ